MPAMSKLMAAAVLVGTATADMYMHFPPGHNDRCDEKNNNRNNDERVMDTENNAAGGYPISDSTYAFYEDTDIWLQWMSQHSCGNGAVGKDTTVQETTVCQHVIQFTCNTQMQKFVGAADLSGAVLTDGVSLGRPAADRPDECEDDLCSNAFNTAGNTCTQTRPDDNCVGREGENDATCNALTLPGDSGTFNSDTCECSTRKLMTYALNEPATFYAKCKARQRNKGLFTADQNVSDNQGATATRQEPNSDRYGFECTEERDYYPYWHPSPWMDIAILTTNTSMCGYYRTESQNVKAKGECVATDEADYLAAAANNNALDCTAAGYTWQDFEAWGIDAPECLLPSFQTDNRLGNVAAIEDSGKVAGQMAGYQWQVPGWVIPDGQDSETCVLRVRYNISTAETPFFADASDNGAISDDPVIKTNAQSDQLAPNMTIPLRLAINTAQFARTFQDRTYTFQVVRRPSTLKGKTIHNLNVLGKRGNIAQVRNCLEYDFTPKVLNVEKGDYVHFQYSMSDYHNNGNDGEGRQGTDRVNIIPIASSDASGNYPAIFDSENPDSMIFTDADIQEMAWLGQRTEDCYTTEEMLNSQKNNGNGVKSCHFLNGLRQYDNPQARYPLSENPKLPSGYFSKVAKVENTGSFTYMSSRNNNFSNRSQKAVIYSSNSSAAKAGAIAGIVIGSVVGVALIGVASFFVVKKVRYSTRV